MPMFIELTVAGPMPSPNEPPHRIGIAVDEVRTYRTIGPGERDANPGANCVVLLKPFADQELVYVREAYDKVSAMLQMRDLVIARSTET